MNQKGQSTIEFAVTLLIFLSFTFFFIQLCFVMAFGSFAQYATFMSSRAFLSAGADYADQEERAKSVAVRLLKNRSNPGIDRWPSIAKGVGGEPAGLKVGPGDQFDSSQRYLSWQEGVRYTFRSRLFLVPLFQNKEEAGSGIELTSESWLGREENYDRCTEALQKSGVGSIFDNGC